VLCAIMRFVKSCNLRSLLFHLPSPKACIKEQQEVTVNSEHEVLLNAFNLEVLLNAFKALSILCLYHQKCRNHAVRSGHPNRRKGRLHRNSSTPTKASCGCAQAIFECPETLQFTRVYFSPETRVVMTLGPSGLRCCGFQRFEECSIVCCG